MIISSSRPISPRIFDVNLSGFGGKSDDRIADLGGAFGHAAFCGTASVAISLEKTGIGVLSETNVCEFSYSDSKLTRSIVGGGGAGGSSALNALPL